MIKKLQSKKIIITGGSMGIGLAVAKECVLNGAEVIIAARNRIDLEKANYEVNKLSESNHLSYSLDVSDINSVKEFAEWLKSKEIKVDGLVNCAGILGPIGKTTDVDMNEFTEVINVNLLGTVYMCNIFSSLFSKDKYKKIVNFSGGGGASPFPNYSAYASSKAAIIRFTENIALELAKEKFDINCVAPGFVVTRLHQQTLSAGSEKVGNSYYDNTNKQIEDGGVPPEIAAELCSFLLSNDSDGITGKFISAPWDPWKDKDFQMKLREDDDFAALRRIDDKYFSKIK